MSRAICPSAQQLSAFLRGELFDALAEQLSEHVTTCDACCRLLAALPNEDHFTQSLRQAAVINEPPPLSLITLQRRLSELPGQLATLSGSTDATQHPLAPQIDERNDFRRLLSPPQASGELGSLGPYRVLRVLGEGGMGVVLLAEETALKRKVALKIMQPKYALDREVAARFDREARATAAIRSDHVVSILAVGEAETPLGRVPFMAMERLRGQSLEQRLKQGLPSVTEVLDWARQIATGLAAVHAKGFIHRDIKPGNIWLETLAPTSGAAGTSSAAKTYRAKLLDFGLAHVGAAVTALTQMGTLIGTPAYMSPEQASGLAVDARSDLFSLGAVLYEMTTGLQPFRGSNMMAVLMSLGRDTPASPRSLLPEIPERLSNLIVRLLEKDREQRPATALAVIEELRTIKSDLSEAPQLPSARVTSQPEDSRSRRGVSRRSQTAGSNSARDRRLAPSRSHEASFFDRLLGNSTTSFWRRVLISVCLLGVVIGAGAGLQALLVRVQTEKGTLVIETDDDSVEVRITKNGATILDRTKDRKLELALGEYGIELVNKVDGLKLSAERITITREGQPPIRISSERPLAVAEANANANSNANVRQDASRRSSEASVSASPKVAGKQTSDTPAASVLPVTKTEAPSASALPPVTSKLPAASALPLTDLNPALLERPQVLLGEGSGKWRVRDGELFCAEPSGGVIEDWLFFGLLDWTDYDYSIEARSEPATEGHGPGVFFRAKGGRRATLAVMNAFRSKHDNLEEISGSEWRAPWNTSHMPKHVGSEVRDWTKQWRTIRVSVRGTSAKVFVEDQQILTYDKLAQTSGYVGVRSHHAWPSRYRNPRVTLPDGRVLLDGWPAIPQTINSVDTAAARRFVDWALSHSGVVVAPGKVLNSGDDLPASTMLHLIGFNNDPAVVRPIKDSDLEAFRDFPGVENYLNFRFPDFTTAGVIKLGTILRGKPIQCFGLVDSPIGLAWLREPGGLGEMTNAIFQNINATDDELRQLKNLRYLRQLNLTFNKGVTDAGIEYLVGLPDLKYLHVDGTSITAAGLKRLREAYPQVEITPATP